MDSAIVLSSANGTSTIRLLYALSAVALRTHHTEHVLKIPGLLDKHPYTAN